MKARLDDLKGKYYGTSVSIYGEDGVCTGSVVIWLNPTDKEDYEPSERELQAWDTWQREVFNEPPDPYEICDNHYETTMAYVVAQKLVEAINSEA